MRAHGLVTDVPEPGAADHLCWGYDSDDDAFDVLLRGEVVGRVEWELSGLHNQMNALAAIAAADHVGVAPAVAARALGSFRNVRRRMELRGTVG